MSDSSSTSIGAADAVKLPQEPARPRKSPPTKTLPSDRLVFEKQVAGLRAFAVSYSANGGKPVTNEEAGKIIGMAAGTIVVTNAFFCELGFLQRQKDSEGFIPSQDVMAYVKAYEWDPERAKEKLRGPIEASWFAQTLVPRIKFRPYDASEAVTVLAEACAASKEYEPRLWPLIDYLAFVGIITRDGSLLKIASGQSFAPTEASPQPNGNSLLAPTESGVEQFTLTLDPKSKRKITIQCPPTIKKAELARIQAWLALQIIIEDE